MPGYPSIDRRGGRGPRQLHGCRAFYLLFLKSEVKAGQQAGWINENGEEVTAVMMRKDIYAHVLRVSDHSEQMREYIHTLERNDKDEQERHTKEINDLTKEKQREIQALQTEVAFKAATIEQLRARLAERSELLHQTTKLADQLKGEIVKQRKSYVAKLVEAQNAVKTVEFCYLRLCFFCDSPQRGASQLQWPAGAER
jgi:small-conductance mechanosensitive channel